MLPRRPQRRRQAGTDLAARLVPARTRWGGPGGPPGLFRAKLVFALTLTAAAVAIHLTYAAIRRGGGAAAARLPKVGPVAGAASPLAVLPVDAFG